MKPDYKNWVPKGMVALFWAGTALALVLFLGLGVTPLLLHGTARTICAVVLGAGTLALAWLCTALA